MTNVPAPVALTPAVPPDRSQLDRIESYRETVHQRMVAAREAADYLHSIWSETAYSIPTTEDADAVELRLLRTLMDSTRPNPIHLSAAR
jgi:hypothetical protein